MGYKKGSRYKEGYFSFNDILYPIEPDSHEQYHLVIGGKIERKGTNFIKLPEQIQDRLTAEYKRRFKLVIDREKQLMELFEKTKKKGKGWSKENGHELFALDAEKDILHLKYDFVLQSSYLRTQKKKDDKRKKPWEHITKDKKYSWQIAEGNYTDYRHFKKS